MTTWLIALGGALLAVIAAFVQGRVLGKRAESTANRAKEADAYEKELSDAADAVRARNAVRADIVPDADPYRRD